MLLVYDPRCRVRAYIDALGAVPYTGNEDFTGLDVGFLGFTIWNPWDEIIQKLSVARSFTWFATDLIYGPPSQLQKLKIRKVCVANGPRIDRKWTAQFDEWHEVHLNYAGFNPITPRLKNGRVVYWGSCRPKRVEAFRRFLPHVDLSCTPRALRKFMEICPVNYVGHLSLDELSAYSATIYMEDKVEWVQHKAMRFYEALSMRMAIVYDLRPVDYALLAEVQKALVQDYRGLLKKELLALGL